MHGFSECTEYLLFTVNVDNTCQDNEDGASPLHMACWGGSLRIVIMLVRQRVPLDCVSKVSLVVKFCKYTYSLINAIA
jgi:ankyrin repeat protein